MKSKVEKMKLPPCTDLCTLVVSSPIGEIMVQCCQKGLHMVHQCETDDKTFSPDKSRPVEIKTVTDAKPPIHAEQCVEWLKNYFTHRIAPTDIPPLCPSIVNEGSFRYQAWRKLPTAVPLGKTITYLQLATLCGNSQACRAAGSAMSSNNISFLIPCHRVIPSNGGLGNYSHGRKNLIKAWLLDFEKAI